MRKELCKFCGTRDHHQSEMHLCKAMQSTDDQPASTSVEVAPPDVAVAVPKDVPAASRNAEPDRMAEARSPDEVSGPLTPAEKQRRYREKHGTAYLAREVERMRRKRGG